MEILIAILAAIGAVCVASFLLCAVVFFALDYEMHHRYKQLDGRDR
jgi:hypothetical protein